MQNKITLFNWLEMLTVTWLLITINLLVYVVQLVNGVAWFNPSPDTLTAWGGNMAVLSLTGETWRLLSNIFVNAGLLHLLANSVMLYLVGTHVERLYGKINFLLLFLIGGVLASFASATWHSTHIEKMGYMPALGGLQARIWYEHLVSVGASGAILAVCGIILVSLLLQRYSAPAADTSTTKEIRYALVQVIIFNLLLGHWIERFDQAAHVGGLLTGTVIGVGMWVWSLAEQGPWLRRSAQYLATGLLLAVVLLKSTGSNVNLLEIREEFDRQRQAILDEAIQEKKKQQAILAYHHEIKNLPAPVADKIARGRIMSVSDCASAMEIADDERQAYVVDSAENRFIVVDLQTGAVLNTLQAPKLVEIGKEAHKKNKCDGIGAETLAILTEQKLALVPSLYPDSVAVVDLNTGKLIRNIPVGHRPRRILVSADKARAYVRNTLSGSISIIDLKKWTVIKSVSLLERVKGVDITKPMWLSEDDVRLYVMNYHSDFDIFDTEKLKFTGTLTTSATFSSEVDHPTSKNKKFLLQRNMLHKINAGSFEGEEYWKLCAKSAPDRFDVYQDTNGTEYIAALFRRDTDLPRILLANLHSLVTVGTYPLSETPQQVQFSKDGKRLFVLGIGGTISIINTQERMHSEPDDLLLCVPPEYFTGKEFAFEAEKNKISTEFNNVLTGKATIQDYLDFSQNLAENSLFIKEHAFQLANYSTKLVGYSLRNGADKSAENVIYHYINSLLPRTGMNEKSMDLASIALHLSVVNKNENISNLVFKKMLGPGFDIDSQTNEILLFNLACYYALHKEKESLLKAMKQALKQGKKADQFMTDTDFKDYLEDVDFLNVLKE